MDRLNQAMGYHNPHVFPPQGLTQPLNNDTTTTTQTLQKQSYLPIDPPSRNRNSLLNGFAQGQASLRPSAPVTDMNRGIQNVEQQDHYGGTRANYVPYNTSSFVGTIGQVQTMPTYQMYQDYSLVPGYLVPIYFLNGNLLVQGYLVY